jgi:hypothetical protein
MELRIACVERIIAVAQGQVFNSMCLSDNFLKIATGLLNLKLPLQPGNADHMRIVASMLECMRSCVSIGGEESNVSKAHATSLSFSTLVFTFISKYKPLASLNKTQFEYVVSKLKTFIQRPAAQALAQL